MFRKLPTPPVIPFLKVNLLSHIEWMFFFRKVCQATTPAILCRNNKEKNKKPDSIFLCCVEVQQSRRRSPNTAPVKPPAKNRPPDRPPRCDSPTQSPPTASRRREISNPVPKVRRLDQTFGSPVNRSPTATRLFRHFRQIVPARNPTSLHTPQPLRPFFYEMSSKHDWERDPGCRPPIPSTVPAPHPHKEAHNPAKPEPEPKSSYSVHPCSPAPSNVSQRPRVRHLPPDTKQRNCIALEKVDLRRLFVKTIMHSNT